MRISDWSSDVCSSDLPPTSGPHQPGPPVDGVLDEPLSRPIQVGILERGDVLLQHDPDLDTGDLETLESLAQERDMLAPKQDHDDAVVATARVYKWPCTAVDAEALTEIIATRFDHDPEECEVEPSAWGNDH